MDRKTERTRPRNPGPRVLRGVGVLILAVAAGGCGDLTPGGVGDAEADVVVTGDASRGGGSSAVSPIVPSPDATSARGAGGAEPGERDPRPALVLDGASADDDEPEGEIEVTFRAFLIGADGTLVALTDDEVEVNVDIPGRTEAEVVRGRRIPAATYSGVRLVFTEIEAEVDEGLVIGGRPVLGEIEVELDADALEVERSVNLVVPEGGRVELVIDLNSTAWLNAANPALKIVAANIFRNSVRVRVR